MSNYIKGQWNENGTDQNWMNNNRNNQQNAGYMNDNRSNQQNAGYMDDNRSNQQNAGYMDDNRSNQQNAGYMDDNRSDQQNAGYMDDNRSNQQNTGYMDESRNSRYDDPIPGTCGGLIHVIRQGDTLYKLSQAYHVTVSDIMYENPYANVYNLQIGDELCIPVSKRQY